jgi:hypothetical protein
MHVWVAKNSTYVIIPQLYAIQQARKLEYWLTEKIQP